MPRVFVIAALIVGLSGCAHSARLDEPRTRNSVLTREEITATPVSTAYEALDRLRPSFLRPHATGGRPATAYAVVFIDGVRRGALDVLRSVAANAIVEIRYLSAADATTRYGLDVQGGVIDVRLLGR